MNRLDPFETSRRHPPTPWSRGRIGTTPQAFGFRIDTCKVLGRPGDVTLSPDAALAGKTQAVRERAQLPRWGADASIRFTAFDGIWSGLELRGRYRTCTTYTVVKGSSHAVRRWLRAVKCARPTSLANQTLAADENLARLSQPAVAQPCRSASLGATGAPAGRPPRLARPSAGDPCAPCPCRRPAVAPRAVRRLGGEPRRPASRTRRKCLAGDAPTAGGLRLRVRRGRPARGDVHAGHRAESAPSRQVPRVPGKCSHASRLPRARSRQRGGPGGAGASVGRRLPPRAPAKRPRRSSGTPILRAPRVRPGPQNCVRRLES